ncbi:MAG TPA: SAF domain-containing protein [Nocardioidaceae bacterium]|nr:SAF domain-containing protein [Nocardioidaceae bacterium]
MADTRTSPSRLAASNAGTRLPSARERRPALAALAVLLIVGGAFASGFLALQAGNRADYLRISDDVPQGAEITEDQVETVSLPEEMDGVVSADNLDEVVGLRAVTHLLPGTILTEDMVTKEAGVAPGMEEVPLNVENVAPGLISGDSVKVHTAPDEGQPGVYDAEVLTVSNPDDESGIGGDTSQSTIQLTVLMTEDDASDIAPAIRDEDVAYVARVAPPPSADGSNGRE